MDYIVDASVVSNLLLNSNPLLAKKVRTLLESKANRAYSHILLSYEIANNLRYSGYSQAKAKQLLYDYFDLPIDILGLSDLIYTHALEISDTVNDTAYDACYHALALANNMTYITCDKRYFDRAKQLGSIELLS